MIFSVLLINLFYFIIVGPSETLVSLRGVFYSSPLGKLLKPTFEDRNIKEEAAMNYLNDFLHMMYKPIVEGELQVPVIMLLLHNITWIKDECNKCDKSSISELRFQELHLQVQLP